MLLGGGFPLRQISLLYGEASTGKTILSMQCALEMARKDFRVFYVDADNSFSAHRLERLIGGPEQAEKIVLFQPEDFKDQVGIIENLENVLTKTPALIVVDSITGLYRVDNGGSEKIFARNRELNRQLAHLNSLAARFKLWILLTGQVHSSPTGGEWLVEPVATRTLRHWSDLILRLTQTPRPNVRDCFLEKKNGLDVSGRHCPFKITDEGIEEA